MRTLIKNAKIVNEGKIFRSDVLIKEDRIHKIYENIDETADLLIDAHS